MFPSTGPSGPSSAQGFWLWATSSVGGGQEHYCTAGMLLCCTCRYYCWNVSTIFCVAATRCTNLGQSDALGVLVSAATVAFRAIAFSFFIGPRQLSVASRSRRFLEMLRVSPTCELITWIL